MASVELDTVVREAAAGPSKSGPDQGDDSDRKRKARRRAPTLGEVRISLLASWLWFADYTRHSFAFYKSNSGRLRKELLSGFTVAVLQVPESVAFSYVAGVDPISGLYATAFLGTITGLIGGRPAQISGAAGAMAVVLADLTDDSGPLAHLSEEQRVQHLFMTVIVVGALQTFLGIIQVARLVSLIPETAMIGFMNGLAIIIGLAQASAFYECRKYELFTDCKDSEYEWMSLGSGTTWMVLLIIAMTMLIMHFFPRVPKVGKVLPASLVAVMIVTAFEHGLNRPLFGWDVRTVGETAELEGGLPSLISPWTGIASDDWLVILRVSVSLAAIGLIESVMTLQAVDEITETPPSNFRNNQECIAQGIGNFVCGFFGAMGGDAMIGQSTINVMNGARYRLSAVTAGLFMFVIILVASPLIAIVPISSLTGVLFMVVIHTFNWECLRLFFVIPITESIGIVLVTALSVAFDLAIGVVSGVVWTALCNSWQSGKLIIAETHYSIDHGGDRCRIYLISGPLFFGSTSQFGHLFEPATDPEHIIIDFTDSLICDFSAVAAIRAVSQRYSRFDKRVTIRGLCHRSHAQISRAKGWVQGRNLQTAIKQRFRSRKAAAADEEEGRTGPAPTLILPELPHHHHNALGAPMLSHIVRLNNPDVNPEETLEQLAVRHDMGMEVETSKSIGSDVPVPSGLSNSRNEASM